MIRLPTIDVQPWIESCLIWYSMHSQRRRGRFYRKENVYIFIAFTFECCIKSITNIFIYTFTYYLQKMFCSNGFKNIFSSYFACVESWTFWKIFFWNIYKIWINLFDIKPDMSPWILERNTVLSSQLSS